LLLNETMHFLTDYQLIIKVYNHETKNSSWKLENE